MNNAKLQLQLTFMEAFPIEVFIFKAVIVEEVTSS